MHTVNSHFANWTHEKLVCMLTFPMTHLYVAHEGHMKMSIYRYVYDDEYLWIKLFVMITVNSQVASWIHDRSRSYGDYEYYYSWIWVFVMHAMSSQVASWIHMRVILTVTINITVYEYDYLWCIWL